jgi:uncharacterized RDD family membrane protein YckC
VIAGAAHRDPRAFVTPEAFEVSTELLGLPLATPGRRLVALLIDLVVIGLVTLVTNSFALVLGVVAAVLFVRAGFKRTPVRGSVFGRAMRLSVGCLGVFIAIVTAIAWASLGIGFGGEDEEDAELGALVRDATSGPIGRGMEALLSRAAAEELGDAETLEEAELAVGDLIEGAGELGIGRDAMRALLLDAVPDDAPWAADAPALFDALLGEADVPPTTDTDAALEAEIAAYSTREALDAYAALLDSAPEGGAPSARRTALESRLVAAVGADTLRALADRVAGLEDENREQAADLARAELAVREASGGGVLDWLGEFVDVLGFGFGWASLYLTVALSTWKGRTVGKRLMGVRVLRLDGQPITWWVAFERAGGYAAGFATGLLGFAQVFWDANRQAIHDRIVGTVVIREGMPKIPHWESAL